MTGSAQHGAASPTGTLAGSRPAPPPACTAAAPNCQRAAPCGPSRLACGISRCSIVLRLSSSADRYLAGSLKGGEGGKGQGGTCRKVRMEAGG